MQLRVDNSKIVGGMVPTPVDVFRPQEYRPYMSSMRGLLSPDHAAMRPLNTMQSTHSDIREIWTGWMTPVQVFKPFTGTQGRPMVVPVENNLQPYQQNVV